ncbi:MAG TPA: YciI family protein [Acidobacteriaceae bacterium]
MKYILMMHCPRTGYELMGAWSKKAVADHIAFMHALNKDLREAGELAAAEGLADPKQAVIVRVGKDGAPVTDGVFPESKEFLAGYWIVDVESEKRAHEIAARASSAPGADGKPFIIPIEVRQVMSAPPDEFVV